MITESHYKYVDPGHINEMADGDDDFILQIIEIYLTTIPDNVNKLSEIAAGNDYANIIFYTHKLRGSLNFIGGKPLIETLDKIDELCNAQTALPTIRELVKEVSVISKHIITELLEIKQQVEAANAG